METEGVFRVRQKESSFDESKQGHFSVSKQTHLSFYEKNSAFLLVLVFWITVGLSQAVGLACIALVTYWCTLFGGFAWASDAEKQFFFHPLLMILGLVFCYGDAIIVYRVLSFLPKWILKLVHAALHLSAIVASSVGLAAVFENHRRTKKADMYSLHSWVGIAAFGLFCLQYVSSFITFLVPGIPLTVRAAVMPVHKFFGVAIFTLAIAAAEMGLTERLLWSTGYSSGTEIGHVGNSLGILLIVFGFLVVFIATQSRYKRKPLPSEIEPTN